MRSRKWLGGVVVLTAIGVGAVTANAVIGSGSSPRPSDAQVDVRMDASSAPAATRRAKATKPKVVYLTGDPSTVDTAATGPYVDVRLFSCPGTSRVIGGGVVPSNTNVFQQGSYTPNAREYHVLLGYDDETINAGGATSFTITSHLICLKGAR